MFPQLLYFPLPAWQERCVHAHESGVRILKYCDSLKLAVTVPMPPSADTLREQGE